MERILGRFAPYFYGLLRIAAGLLFACHGAQKLFGVLGGQQVQLASKFGLAGIIELVGGVLIAAGIFTSPLAFVASGEMAFAYFQAHHPRGLWPIQNGGGIPSAWVRQAAAARFELAWRRIADQHIARLRAAVAPEPIRLPYVFTHALTLVTVGPLRDALAEAARLSAAPRTTS